MELKKTLVGMAVLALLVAGLAVPAALAQEADDPAADTLDQLSAEQTDQIDDQRQEELAEALAEELGLDPETVSDALGTVREERTEERREERRTTMSEWLDELVEDGVLTQEQADALRGAYESGAVQALRQHFREGGEGPFGGNGPIRGRGPHGGEHQGFGPLRGWQFDGA